MLLHTVGDPWDHRDPRPQLSARLPSSKSQTYTGSRWNAGYAILGCSRCISVLSNPKSPQNPQNPPKKGHKSQFASEQFHILSLWLLVLKWSLPGFHSSTAYVAKRHYCSAHVVDLSLTGLASMFLKTKRPQVLYGQPIQPYRLPTIVDYGQPSTIAMPKLCHSWGWRWSSL